MSVGSGGSDEAIHIPGEDAPIDVQIRHLRGEVARLHTKVSEESRDQRQRLAQAVEQSNSVDGDLRSRVDRVHLLIRGGHWQHLAADHWVSSRTARFSSHGSPSVARVSSNQGGTPANWAVLRAALGDRSINVAGQYELGLPRSRVIAALAAACEDEVLQARSLNLLDSLISDPQVPMNQRLDAISALAEAGLEHLSTVVQPTVELNAHGQGGSGYIGCFCDRSSLG